MNLDDASSWSDKPQAVIITGMHRSGTSLLASILQTVGVNIGQQLMGAGPGNIKGHFEDIDFWSIHQSILISQGISPEGWTALSKVDVPQQFFDEAKALCDKRMKEGPIWGWKEPRTTLFLEFWDQLIPHAKYVFVYREPWEVLDSLFLRGDVAFINNPNLAIQVWVAYNTAVLEFYRLNADRSVLIHPGCLRGQASGFIDLVRSKLQLKLCSLEEELFDKRLMHYSPLVDYRIALLNHFYPKAVELFQDINAAADLPSFNSYPELASLASISKDWIFQDWLNTQRLTKQQAGLQQAEAKLEQTQAELRQAEARLEQAHAELRQTRTNLIATQQIIRSIENSKFWKIRQSYLQLKRWLGIVQN